jgi:hypothetical protein
MNAALLHRADELTRQLSRVVDTLDDNGEVRAVLDQLTVEIRSLTDAAQLLVVMRARRMRT